MYSFSFPAKQQNPPRLCSTIVHTLLTELYLVTYVDVSLFFVIEFWSCILLHLFPPAHQPRPHDISSYVWNSLQPAVLIDVEWLGSSP
jgi:hypothetical protein